MNIEKDLELAVEISKMLKTYSTDPERQRVILDLVDAELEDIVSD